MDVIISKMFAGKFNEDSIGHEVINFIKPDNSNDSYIYTPSKGDSDEVDCVILISKAEDYAYPILAIACEVEVAKLEDEEKIRYGRKLIKDINFKEEDFNEKVGRVSSKNLNKKNLTYKVLNNSLKKPKETIYIIPKPAKNKVNEVNRRVKELDDLNIKYVKLDKENPQHDKCYCWRVEVNNKELYELIQDAKQWEDYPLKKTNELKSKIQYKDESFLNFIEKENSEQIYTNMICKVLNKAGKRCRKEFVDLLLKDVDKKDGLNFDEDFSVKKEKILKDSKYKGRMDLLIESSNLKIIIENKIKSDLNGIFVEDEIEKSQIDKYRNYLNELCGKTEQEAKGWIFILKPNYSKVNSENVYKVIEYSNLYEFFVKRKKWFKGDKYFGEFLNALAKQSLTKEQEINRRFLQTLK